LQRGRLEHALCWTSFVIVMSCTASTSGCVIPPPTQQEADAGGFHAPRFLSFVPSTDVQYAVYQGDLETKFTVELEDVDNQTLYARFFFYRAGAVPSYSQSVAIVPDTAVVSPLNHRATQTFYISGLCDQYANNTLGTYYLELYVSDTEFLKPESSAGDLRQNKPGGYRINDQWLIQCRQTLGTPDGGV
jgi:hypothetical protein